MVTLFYDMMHKEIKVYVDDMIAKFQGEDDHVRNQPEEVVRAIDEIPAEA